MTAQSYYAFGILQQSSGDVIEGDDIYSAGQVDALVDGRLSFEGLSNGSETIVMRQTELIGSNALLDVKNTNGSQWADVRCSRVTAITNVRTNRISCYNSSLLISALKIASDQPAFNASLAAGDPYSNATGANKIGGTLFLDGGANYGYVSIQATGGPSKFGGTVRTGLFTFDTVPTASSYPGHEITISDRGYRGAKSDGTNWRFIDDWELIS